MNLNVVQLIWSMVACTIVKKQKSKQTNQMQATHTKMSPSTANLIDLVSLLLCLSAIGQATYRLFYIRVLYAVRNCTHPLNVWKPEFYLVLQSEPAYLNYTPYTTVLQTQVTMLPSSTPPPPSSLSTLSSLMYNRQQEGMDNSG